MSGMASVAVILASMGGAPDGVVLNFSASWCGPCQSMKPVVKRLQSQGYAIQQIDFDRNRQLANQFGVTHLPTFLLVVDGKVRQRVVGPMSEASLRRMALSVPKRTNRRNTGPRNGGESSVSSTRPATNSSSHAPQRATIRRPVVRANIDSNVSENATRDPIAVCTRIRVRQAGSVDLGSGTVIHSEPGRTLILTCGHIFRGFTSGGTIEVDFFHQQDVETYDAKLVRADLKADVGLIELKEVTTFPSATIAPKSLQKGDHVYSIGCGRGNPPSRLQHLVTETKGFEPDLVECTGLPVQGRSGGGLFTREGNVVGVCVFADQESRRGLYATLRSIHRLLDACGLSKLAPTPGSSSGAVRSLAEHKDQLRQDRPRFADEEDGAVGNKEDGAVGNETEPKRLTLTRIKSEAGRPPELPTNQVGKDVAQRKFVPRFGVSFDEIEAADRESRLDAGGNATRRLDRAGNDAARKILETARDAQVVCVIRPGTTQQQVLIVKDASDEFLKSLTKQLRSSDSFRSETPNP